MKEDQLKSLQQKVRDAKITFKDVYDLIEHLVESKTVDGISIKGNKELEDNKNKLIREFEDHLFKSYESLGIFYEREYEHLYEYLYIID